MESRALTKPYESPVLFVKLPGTNQKPTEAKLKIYQMNHQSKDTCSRAVEHHQKAQSAPNDNGTLNTDQGSTTVAASRNWVHQTPALGDRNYEEEASQWSTPCYPQAAPMNAAYYYP